MHVPFYVYMCTYVCVYVYVSAYMHAHLWAWRPKVDIGWCQVSYLTVLLSYMSLGSISHFSLNPELAHLASLASHPALGICLQLLC